MVDTPFRNKPALLASRISFEFIHTILVSTGNLTTRLVHVYDSDGVLVDTVEEHDGDRLGSWKIDFDFDPSVVKLLGVESNFHVDNDESVNAFGIYYKIDNSAMCD